MGTWASIESAIYGWVNAQLPSGWKAVWAEQQVSALETSFVTLRIGDVRALGATDFETYAGNINNPPNDVTLTENGVREFPVSLQAFGSKGQTTGDNSPRAVMSVLRQSLEFPDVRYALEISGLSPFDNRQPIRNVSTVAGTIFEPRALWELKFYYLEQATETTTYIETVDAGVTSPGPQEPIPGTVTLPDGSTVDYPSDT